MPNPCLEQTRRLRSQELDGRYQQSLQAEGFPSRKRFHRTATERVLPRKKRIDGQNPRSKTAATIPNGVLAIEKSLYMRGGRCPYALLTRWTENPRFGPPSGAVMQGVNHRSALFALCTLCCALAKHLRHEATMQTIRNVMLEMQTCQWTLRQVAPIQNNHIAAMVLRIIYQCQHPPIIFLL